MAELTGGIVLLVRKPDPEPWAAPGLPSDERARLAVAESIRRYGPGGGDAMEPIYEAFRAARADVLLEAARGICGGCAEGLPLVKAEWDGSVRHAMRGGGNTLPCHAAAIHAIEGNDS